MPGYRQVDKIVPLVALHGVTPSSSTPLWISLKGYQHVTALVTFKNATTVTGSAIGLQQATDVSGTSAKTLGFTTMWACADDSTSSAVTQTAVSSNTFTTSSVNSKTGFYIIEVDAITLDVANGFDCFQVTTGNATATTIEVTYWLAAATFGGASYGYMNPRAN